MIDASAQKLKGHVWRVGDKVVKERPLADCLRIRILSLLAKRAGVPVPESRIEQHGDKFYVVHDWIEGTPLDKVLRAERKRLMATAEKLLAWQDATGVSDRKPANYLVDLQGVVWAIDVE